MPGYRAKIADTYLSDKPVKVRHPKARLAIGTAPNINAPTEPLLMIDKPDPLDASEFQELRKWAIEQAIASGLRKPSEIQAMAKLFFRFAIGMHKPRQGEHKERVLELSQQGKNRTEIAEILQTSPNSVSGLLHAVRKEKGIVAPRTAAKAERKRFF